MHQRSCGRLTDLGRSGRRLIKLTSDQVAVQVADERESQIGNELDAASLFGDLIGASQIGSEPRESARNDFRFGDVPRGF